MIYNVDCISYMKAMGKDSVDLTLTDIPYDGVNRANSGIRNLDKGFADILTFNLVEFADLVYNVTKNNIIIFCGFGQISTLYNYFVDKKGMTRILVWDKKNPSVLNAQYCYLSSVELAVYFRKPNGVFNNHYKKPIFNYPVGSSDIHPTEKHHGLLKELILDCSNTNDIVFDPCAGSGSTLLVAKENFRQYLGCELNTDMYKVCVKRLKDFF